MNDILSGVLSHAKSTASSNRSIFLINACRPFFPTCFFLLVFAAPRRHGRRMCIMNVHRQGMLTNECLGLCLGKCFWRCNDTCFGDVFWRDDGWEYAMLPVLYIKTFLLKKKMPSGLLEVDRLSKDGYNSVLAYKWWRIWVKILCPRKLIHPVLFCQFWNFDVTLPLSTTWCGKDRV